MHSTFLAPTHKLIRGTRLARRGRRDIAFYDCRETCKDFGTRASHAGSDPITSSLTPDKFAAGNLVAFHGRIPPLLLWHPDPPLLPWHPDPPVLPWHLDPLLPWHPSLLWHEDRFCRWHWSLSWREHIFTGLLERPSPWSGCKGKRHRRVCQPAAAVPLCGITYQE